MLADLQIILLDSQRTVQVRLPLEQIYPGGPGHCLVDGVSHPLLEQPDVSGFVLELSPPRSQGPAIAEKAQDHVRDAISISTRRVQLRLHGRADSLPNGGTFRFTGPAVSASTFRATLPEEFALLRVRGLPGQMLSKTNAKSIQGMLAASKTLELSWSQKPDQSPLPAKNPPRVCALATVHPLWIEWQIRVKNPPRTGSSSSVWSLPAHTLVKNVKSDRLDSFDARSDKTSTRLLLEFQEPLAREFSVEIHCLTPRDLSGDSQPGLVRLPALDFFPSPPPDSAEPEYLLGVNATPELALGTGDFSAKIAKDVFALPPEKFLSAYRMASSESLTIRGPQYAWKLLKPGEIALPIQSRTPARRARLNQEGQLSDRELKWMVTVEIETSGAKAFRHVLTVPEGFLIDSVSIEEDETERLDRWTLTGTRLELVLSDGTTGIQNVNLSGSQPFAIKQGDRVKLPMIQVENAEIVDSRLHLFGSRMLKHQVRVIGIEDQPALDDDLNLGEMDGLRLLAGVRLVDHTRVPSIVVGGALEEFRLDKLIRVQRENASQIQASTLLHFLDSGHSPQPLQIRLPASMTRDFRVKAANHPGRIVPYEILTNPDQSLELVFHAGFHKDVQTLQIDALVDSPQFESWQLPDLRVIGGRVERAFLLASAEFMVHSIDDADWPQTVTGGEIPAWFRETDPSETLPAGMQCYRDPNPAWRLLPAIAGERKAGQAFLVHSEIWLTDPQIISGQTRIQLPLRGPKSMVFDWPEGTILEAVLLDGNRLSPEIHAENQTLTQPIPPRGESRPANSDRTLAIYWSRKPASPLPRFGQLELSLPKPKNIPLDQAHLAIVPASHTRLIPQQGFESSQPKLAKDSAEQTDNALVADLSGGDSQWKVSVWTMDSRSEEVLLMGLLVLILGGCMHWGLRFHAGEWLHEHHRIACGVLGLLWWICFLGSAWGFLVFLFSPLLFMAKKTNDRRSSSPT